LTKTFFGPIACGQCRGSSSTTTTLVTLLLLRFIAIELLCRSGRRRRRRRRRCLRTRRTRPRGDEERGNKVRHDDDVLCTPPRMCVAIFPFFSAFLVNEHSSLSFYLFFPKKHHNARALSLLLGAFRDAARTPPRSSSCCSRYSLLSARVALRSSARGAHRGGAAKIDANKL